MRKTRSGRIIVPMYLLPDRASLIRHNTRVSVQILMVLALSLYGGAALTGNLSYGAWRRQSVTMARCDAESYPTEHWATPEDCRSWLRSGEVRPFGAAAVASLALAIALTVLTLGLRVRTPPFVRIVEQRLQDVVWVFGSEHTLRRQTSPSSWSVGVGTGEGVLAVIEVDSRARRDDIVAGLSAAAPLATRGYSVELLTRFQSDPGSFGRAP